MASAADQLAEWLTVLACLHELGMDDPHAPKINIIRYWICQIKYDAVEHVNLHELALERSVMAKKRKKKTI